MSNLEKIISACFLAGAVVFGGCDSGGSSKKKKNTSSDSLTVKAIPQQVVQEGNSMSLDLKPYISSSKGYTITQTTGPGAISDKNFSYQDIEDEDGTNNKHVVNFQVTSGNLKKYGSFIISQNDIIRYSPPGCFLQKANWIGFSPTNYNPVAGTYPSDESIGLDLDALTGSNFKGIVLYGANDSLTKAAKAAKAKNLGVVAGIWDINDAAEWNNALSLRDFVDGYCIGNEGIKDGRYTLAQVKEKIRAMKIATGKPVTTTERIDDYDAELFKTGDWVFPNAHPYWHSVTEPVAAANWTVDKYKEYQQKINDLGINRMLVFKEAGMPSGGAAGLSEANQNTYFRKLEDLIREDSSLNMSTILSYFEAFDQPWKDWDAAEPWWGYFKSDRGLKEVSKPQALGVYVPPIGSFENFQGRAVNVKPGDYKIATYIQVNGGWWVKPYANTLTSIPSSGTYVVDITTGGADSTATKINLSIVDPSYVPALNTLPSTADPKVITQTTITR